MIIKKIIIKNFRSYYGENTFELSDGLNLIIGDTGDGKTTFLEALQWLLNTTIDKGNIDHLSQMRKSKLEIGESDEVSVYMEFEHDGIKSVEKNFTVERSGDNDFRVGKLNYRGYETNGSEREAVNGKTLIDRCYDAFIQRFSMFKGESQLDVFDNATALKDLVDKFSDISQFDRLVEYTEQFESKAETAYTKEMRSDKKISGEAEILDNKLKRCAAEIQQKQQDIKDKEDSYNTFKMKLDKMEQSQEQTESFHEIKDRLSSLNERIIKVKAQIKAIDYNHSLLDHLWVLCAFPSVLKEFQKKCSALSHEKRRQERDFDRQQAAIKAKLETIQEVQGALINGATELPWYLPNQETMEEMLRDHICKVCGREAPEDSEAFHFMTHKLEQYKAHIEMKLRREKEKKALEEQSLFKQEHIEELHNFGMSLSGNQEAEIASIANDIQETLNFIAKREMDLGELQEKYEETEDEKTRLLIQAGNVSESFMESRFKDIKGLYEQKNKAEVRLTELRGELDVLKEKADELKARLDELKPSSAKVKAMGDIHRVLSVIAQAFLNAKKDNLRRFLSDLEERANFYIDALSSSDFHGVIHLRQTANNSTEIHLFSKNGKDEVKNPSGSQKTVMYISVLFAISDFTKEKREEDYPLIFDAATSSFSDAKEGDFYAVLSKQIEKQCIVLTKDFIANGKVMMDKVLALDCTVYRIKKAPGFDKRNLATIRTLIEKL